MPGLHETQQRCYDAFVLGHSERVLSLIAGANPEHAVAVYRNNALETARKTLEASYPVVRRLTGDACFRTLSHDYLRRHPSPTGNLDDFGAGFPDLLDDLYGGGDFDYLVDVARLEWACEEAIMAADPAARNLSAVTSVPASRAGELLLRLHPSSRLVSSAYPVFSIWHANTEAEDLTVHLDAGAEQVLVARAGSGLELRRLAPAGGAFVAALLRGENLAAACDAAVAEDAGFDPGGFLRLLAAWNVLTEAALPEFIHC